MKFEAILLEKKDMIVGDNIEKYEGKEINAFIYKNSENAFRIILNIWNSKHSIILQ